jgi:hypothetical protein
MDHPHDLGRRAIIDPLGRRVDPFGRQLMEHGPRRGVPMGMPIRM